MTNRCLTNVKGASGGGDELEVLNLTGSSLAAGDKVWLSPMYLGTSASTASVGTGDQHTYSPIVVSRDGSLVYEPRSGYIYNTTDGTTTYGTKISDFSDYSGTTKYADNGYIWGCITTGSGVSTSLGGASYGITSQYDYVGGDYYYDRTNNVFVKMLSGTMTVDKTFTHDFSIDSISYMQTFGPHRFCYSNGYIYYKKSAEVFSRAIVDDNALTISYDRDVLTLTDQDVLVIPYATSDGKYFIGYASNTSYYSESNGYFRLFASSGSSLVEVSDYATLFPDFVSYYNNSLTTCVYNQQDGILVLSNSSTRGIAVFKYENETFTKIASYTDAMHSGSQYRIYATASADGSVLAYNSGWNGRLGEVCEVMLQGSSAYKAVDYKNVNISPTSLTGVVTTGGAQGENVTVETIMPEV